MPIRGMLLLLVLASGCHESRQYDPTDAFVDPLVDLGRDSGRIGRPPGPADGSVPFDIFVDPGCDGGGGSTTDYACDPLVPDSCGPGMACYGWAEPPTTRCGEERYVAQCFAEGTGEQGTSCLGHTDCRAGYICVVTGAGTQCAASCDVGGGEPSCPRGYLCRATDVPELGACF